MAVTLNVKTPNKIYTNCGSDEAAKNRCRFVSLKADKLPTINEIIKIIKNTGCSESIKSATTLWNKLTTRIKLITKINLLKTIKKKNISLVTFSYVSRAQKWNGANPNFTKNPKIIIIIAKAIDINWWLSSSWKVHQVEKINEISEEEKAVTKLIPHKIHAPAILLNVKYKNVKETVCDLPKRVKK